MSYTSNFVCENNGNIPLECAQISTKLEIFSRVALAQCLTPEQVSSIKQSLCSEVNELKQLIKSEQAYLKSVKDDLSVCKEKIDKIEKWEDACKKLDSVLPVLNKPTNPVVKGTKQPQATAPGVTLNHTDSSQGAIPTFRFIEESEWNSVPSYLKLRMKLEHINDFVQALNKELIKKYTLLKKKKAILTKNERTLRASYVASETDETKGLYFVVASDLKNMGFSEKTVSNMRSILRHCRHLREVRTGKTISLIVTN